MLCSLQGRIHVWSKLAPPPPPLWQINHANSAYFRLFLGYFGVISAIRPSLLDLGPSFYISWIRPCIEVQFFTIMAHITLHHPSIHMKTNWRNALWDDMYTVYHLWGKSTLHGQSVFLFFAQKMSFLRKLEQRLNKLRPRCTVFNEVLWFTHIA